MELRSWTENEISDQTYRTNICWEITTRRLRASNAIATAPAIAPAKAACHRRVCFLTSTCTALVESDSLSFLLPPDAAVGTSGVGSIPPSSSRADAEREDAFWWGFIAGIKMGNALMRNLYKYVKDPAGKMSI